jgi:pimeloyl-ACP methyl ester carboxylesterase
MTAEITAPDILAVPVAGGDLNVAVHPGGEGAPLALGLHGVTASSVSLQPVARELAGEVTLVAPDLRGRGASADLPAPYGMGVHADDCAAVIRTVGGAPAVLVGESMGGYVAVMLASTYPELVRSVVLVDGGLPLPVPDGVPVDAVLAAVLGPALSRLERTFSSVDAYYDFWRDHPSFVGEWNEDIEDYLRYDLIGEEPELRSRVSGAAVEADTADHLSNPAMISDALRSLRCPIALLRATRGLLNQPEPLLPDAVVEPWADVLPQLTVETVEDTNHYSLMFGARGAGRIAAAVRRQLV